MTEHTKGQKVMDMRAQETEMRDKSHEREMNASHFPLYATFERSTRSTQKGSETNTISHLSNRQITQNRMAGIKMCKS